MLSYFEAVKYDLELRVHINILYMSVGKEKKAFHYKIFMEKTSYDKL